MSVIYCEFCDRHVDTDFDLDHCEGDDCEGCICNPDHAKLWFGEDELQAKDSI